MGARRAFRSSSFACLALFLGACAGEGAGDGGGNGTGGPGFGELDMPVPTVVNAGADPLAFFDPGAFNVSADLSYVFSVSDPPGRFNPLTRDAVDTRRDAIYRFDYTTGRVDQLVREPNEGRFAAPLPVIAAADRLYYLTVTSDGIRGTVSEIDPIAGTSISRTEFEGAPERCFAVVDDDLYFASRGELLVARDFAAQGSPASLSNLGPDTLCGAFLATLDGRAVAVDAPTDADPTVDTIAVWALDPVDGAREDAPLVSVPTGDVSLNVTGERPPVIAVGNDGLYVLANSLVEMELWFVPYGRRPGEPAQSSPPPVVPVFLGRVEPPFFADVIPSNGTLALLDIYGLSVRDEIIGIPVRIEESAGDGRFFWDFLFVADVSSGKVDLILLTAIVESFAAFPAAPG